MKAFKVEVMARLDNHESRLIRTESNIQSILETLNYMTLWMDKESAANDRRFEELARDLKAYVDLRHEEALAYFRVLRDEQREQGKILESHSETLRSQGETLRSQGESLRSQDQSLRSQGETLRSQGETLRSQAEDLRTLAQEQARQSAAIHSLTEEQRETNRRLERIEQRLGLGA